MNGENKIVADNNTRIKTTKKQTNKQTNKKIFL
jgi:hypothetical protein